MLLSDHFLSESSNSYLIQFLKNGGDAYYASAMTQIAPDLSRIKMADSFIDSVYIYNSKSDFSDSTLVKKVGLNFTKTKIYQQIKDRIQEGAFWGQVQKDEIYTGETEVIPFVIPFTIPQVNNGDMLIVVNLDSSAIKEYISGIQSIEGGNILIADKKEQKIIMQENNSTDMVLKDGKALNDILSQGDGVTNISNKKDRYILAYSAEKVSPWTIILVRPEKYLVSSLNKARNYTFFVMIISIFLCMLIALIISRGITKPLMSLEKMIKKVTNRNFDVSFTYNKDDEVGQIGKSFNFMLVEIKELITCLNNTIEELHEEKNRVKEEQAFKRKAELTALQAQINPHFLYNTLNSIIWMADKVNANEISLMSAALGTFFKLSLSGGKEIISIRDEILHVQSYLYIQKIRFIDKLNYRMNVNDEILNNRIVKLVLQPLVENAIVHGINEKDGQGEVIISGGFSKDTKDIELYVTDNGAGISPMKLELINRRLREGFSEKQEGYGIYNVNERIRLAFGYDFGISIISELGKGTCVKVDIPVVKTEEAENYV